MPESEEGRVERNRQLNFRITPEIFGDLAIIGAITDMSAQDRARMYIEEGMRRDAEIPEVKEALDAARLARQAMASREQ